MKLEITPQELSTELTNGEDIQLIDVRTPEKHAAFNIGGLLIPLEELKTRSHMLDPKKKVVTYCTSGGKSMIALNLLKTQGFNAVQSLAGGVTAWQKEFK